MYTLKVEREHVAAALHSDIHIQVYIHISTLTNTHLTYLIHLLT